jgi:hypothetical protein
MGAAAGAAGLLMRIVTARITLDMGSTQRKSRLAAALIAFALAPWASFARQYPTKLVKAAGVKAQ